MTQEATGLGVGDLVEVVNPDHITYGEGVVVRVADDGIGYPFVVDSVLVYNDQPEWVGMFKAEHLRLVARAGSHRKKPGGHDGR